MGKRRTRLIISTIIGAVLLVAGVTVIYWPAGLIVAGIAFAAIGVLSDDGEEP